MRAPITITVFLAAASADQDRPAKAVLPSVRISLRRTGTLRIRYSQHISEIVHKLTVIAAGDGGRWRSMFLLELERVSPYQNKSFSAN
jgi:hypothetical protein